MSNSSNPPATPYIPTTSKEPIKDGIVPHIRRIGDLIHDINSEITEMQRIEKALRDAHDRLERHSTLMATEAQLIEALIRRDRPSPPVKALPTNKLADRVEEDLSRLTSTFANTGTQPAQSIDTAAATIISHPVGFTPKR